MDHLTPSDITLLIDFVLASILAIYFSLGKPRTWYKDRLGWVIFGYAVATVFVLGLIVYAMLSGEKVIEPIRFIGGFALGAALIAKTASVYLERREARLDAARFTGTHMKEMS